MILEYQIDRMKNSNQKSKESLNALDWIPDGMKVKMPSEYQNDQIKNSF